MILKFILYISLCISLTLAMTCNELKNQLSILTKENNECWEENGEIVGM